MTENKRGLWEVVETAKGTKYVYTVTFDGVNYVIKTGRSSKNYWVWCRNLDTGNQLLRPSKRIGVNNTLNIEEVKRLIEQNLRTLII